MATAASNVRLSTHPSLLVKLSQLRAATCTPRETQALIHEISLLLASETLASVLSTADAGTGLTPLGLEYRKVGMSPEKIALVPILRSGLGMVSGMS